jgi:hypothetical protein
VAEAQARLHAAKLEEYWAWMRWQKVDEIPGHRFLAPSAVDQSPSGPDLFGARDVYLRLKGEGRGSLFADAANRAVNYAVQAIGNKPLTDYRKADATRYRDSLQDRGLSPSSVRRVLATLRAIINFAINEFGLDTTNPFNGLYIGSQPQENGRTPLSLEKSSKQLLLFTIIGLNNDLG